MYQEDALQRSRRQKGPHPRVVKDVSDGGCGVQRVLLPLLYWVSSGLLACIGLAWGLPGRLRVFDDYVGAGLSTTFLLRL
jgi:hypothetical protein